MYDYNKDENVGGDALDYGRAAVSETHELTKKLIKKKIKRAQIQREQARAAAEAGKQSAKATAEVSKKAAEEAAKIGKALFDAGRRLVSSLVELIIENPIIAVILVVIVVCIIVLHVVKVDLLSLFGSMSESVVAGTYTAYDEDIIGVNSDYTKLEKELRKTINNTEADFPGYDEYEYQLEEIGHNPYELISYLTAAYENFTRRDMKPVIKELFDAQYNLTYTPRTETRSRTVTKYGIENGKVYSYQEIEYYTVSILKVKLNNKGLGSVIASKPLSDVQRARYNLLLETKGNKPDLFEDLYTDIEIPDDLEVPPEALTDQTFAAMIAEGEKYLGRAYVWGGSSPSQGFDCSGVVCWVLNHSGWSVGRTDCNGLKAKCTVVSAEEAKPGDLIFFKGTQKNKAGATHVGIYCGNGIMLHCGNPIQYTSIESNYYRKHFLCYGRLP